MSAKKEKKGRLDQESLEAALEEAFNDPTEETVEITGQENAAGVDPNFAGKLRDKLEGQVAEHPEIADAAGEPSGLRAPACTTILSAKDLAALMDDEADEDGGKIVCQNTNHGFIDNIDSKLVTELNKKLSDEVAHEKEDAKKAAAPAASSGGSSLGPRGAPRGFTTNLSDALSKLEDDEEDEDAVGGLPASSSKDKSSLGPRGCPRGFTSNLNSALEKLDDDTTKDPFSSDLSAALNKKLGGQAAASDPFSADLSAALNKKLGGEDFEEGNANDAMDERVGDGTDEGEAPNCAGLRAPKPTVKLSAEALSKLDAEDDEMDSAMMVAEAHGAITDVNKSLMDELQKKLGGGGAKFADQDDDDDDGEKCTGFRAPMNTVKLDPSMLPPDEEDEPGHGNIDLIDGTFAAQLQSKLAGEAKEVEEEAVEEVGKGCRAPQPTVKLGMDMLAGLDDDDDIEVQDGPMGIMGAAAAVLSRVADPDDIPDDTRDWNEDIDIVQESSAGLRAPAATQLITSDMLADLDDEDDLMADVQGSSFQSKPSDAKKGGVGFSGFDASFAGSLQAGLTGAKSGDGKPTVGMREGNPDEAITPDDDQGGPVCSGLKAPTTTCNLTAAQLAQLGDEDDDIPFVGNPMDDDEEPAKSGLKAPQCTQIVSAEMLAGIDDDDPMDCGPGPSAEQLATLTAAAMALDAGSPPGGPGPDKPPMALTMDSGSATKVIQSMQGSFPNKAGTSSCKLRLAWLSKEEVRKENEQLRKEINSLRAEIEMHRKEATLARKA